MIAPPSNASGAPGTSNQRDREPDNQVAEGGQADADAAALYHSLFEQSPDAMLVATIDGQYVDANPAALALLGYTRDELLRLRFDEVVIPGPTWTAEAYERFIRAGLWQGEVDLRRNDGTTVPTEVRTVVLAGPAGGKFASYFRDLSDRKQNEESRARLAALVRSTADAIIGETLDGIVTDWNPAAERLYGYSAAEMIGQPLKSLIPPEYLPEADEILARARRGESIEDFESVRFTRDGRRIDIALTVSPVWNDARQIVATSAIVRDITKHKATEAALAASEQRFRTAFEDAPIGMVLTTPDGRPLQVNRAICAFLGYSEAELLATTLRDLTHPDDFPINQAYVERILAGEIDAFELEKRYIRQDRQIVWAHLSVSLVRNEAGTPLYFISQIQDITDRKEAEAELAATHQHTWEVLERITDAFLAVDRDWTFTYVNSTAEQILARPREDLLGKNLWHEFPQLVGTALEAAYYKAAAEGTTVDVELQSLFVEGAWFGVRAYPSRNGLSVFFRNITESRQLTQELRASEAKYRTLVEQLPAVVYLFAADGEDTPLYYSPRFEELTGEHPEDAMARPDHWLEDVHPDDRERVVEENDRSVAAGDLFRLEYRLRRKDGSYVWVRDECAPVHDETGQIVAWQGVLLDISDRIAADEARARLAAIVEGAEDAIVSRTLDGVITSWNRGAERLFGYRAEEAIGQPYTMLLSREEIENPLVNAEVFGEQPTRFEATRQRKDGTSIEVAVSLSSIRDRDGDLIGVSSITRDMTERKRAEEALREALEAAQAGIRSKSLFLAMMSHELRTPLQAVLGYADFLLNGPPGSLTPEQREDIGYIRQGAGRMVALIEQMLDLSRMEAGRLEIASEPVELPQIVEQVRQDIAPQVTAKALAFAIDVPAALPAARGDPLRIRQILLNLVGNAVKFTDAGTVCISASASGDGIDIAVRDTGIGIAPEALPYIFEEFRQVDGTMTRRHGGAGLGLAISKRLAEQMGGSITVESQPHVGSTFTLHLVAAKPRKAGGRGTSTARPRSSR